MRNVETTGQQRWLVTGGAGYIGAHVVTAFIEAGHQVVIIDDFSSGHRSFVHPQAHLVEGSILDDEALEKAFALDLSGVIHVAGYKYAGESVSRPLHTYEQNVVGTMRVLGACIRHNVENVVFSSSAAVYGTPDVDNVTETTPTNPESPYGESKLVGEWLLADGARAHGLKHTSLRYFNVIGSANEALRDTSPFNILPLVFRALEAGDVPRINGDDYPTPDGTCVRDYVHVADIAAAHVAAAGRLFDDELTEAVYNLGSSTGTSVAQIMTAISAASGIIFTPAVGTRRAGDPARIVATGALAQRDLAWQNRYTLDEMILGSWAAWNAAH